ncbi:tetratricopeptide repeat protein [Amycolatopsis sp. EV170708-02-1]|uniref:ATP-binding protein n=1 Tax=Amycolatopsis sp. EV170708-02-1 TaxID=2919322 RepID=UPI001F0C4000|nr:tetratricopeptide repeat protein [Amycolatopsis sp. EV170708-02-1]UMP07008.1 tetratricopeptide repeat protein [Amycolatopsis sp. EV170708-02-1]
MVELGTSGAPDLPTIGVLSGPAGVGKTTLALRAAHELTAQFPDGQLFLNLRGFDPHEPAMDPAQALAALLGGLSEDPVTPGQSEAELSAHFRSALAGKRMLVVLDNALNSEQVRPLLPGSSCLVLVTSRNQLNGLVARNGAHVIDLEPLPPEESGTFLARLLGDGPTDETSDDLDRIAALCGHLPLALSIVARRIADRPSVCLSDVVTELSDESARLNALSSDIDAIRPAFSWSYHALKPEPARLFRHLGLYPSDEISTGAAAALISGAPHETRKLLETLANSHLISWAGRDRYRIHDLLHLYTKELVHGDESPQHNASATRRLLDWYLYTTDKATNQVDPARSATRHRPEPPPGDCRPLDFADEATARKWILAESPSLCAVLRHAAGNGFEDHVWKTLCLVWEDERKGPREPTWTELLEDAFETATRRGDSHAKLWLAGELGYTYLYLQRLDQAKAYFDLSLKLWSTDGVGHPKTGLLQALALTGSAHILFYAGDPQHALQHCHEALPALRENGYAPGQIWALGLAGTVYRVLGMLPEAEGHLQEAFSMCRLQPRRSPMLESFILLDLGLIEQSRGQLEKAAVFLQQALKIAKDMGNALTEIRMLQPLQSVLQDLGQLAEAETHRRRIRDLMERNSISEDLLKAVSSS